jgi:hypothetical protein
MRRSAFWISFSSLICASGVTLSESAAAQPEAPRVKQPTVAVPAGSAAPVPPAAASPAPDPLAITPPVSGGGAPPVTSAQLGQAASGVEAFVRAQAELGCDYRSHVVTANQVLVACGAGGVVLLVPAGSSYSVAERRPAGGGAVVDFFEQGGAVWAHVVEDRAIQVAAGHIVGRGAAAEVPAAQVTPAAMGRPLAAPVQASLPQPQLVPVGPLSGRVVSVRARTVTINLGRENGLKVGDRIAFFEEAPTDSESLDSAEKTAVVGLVVDAASAASTVRVGFGEDVSVEALAAVTGSPVTASRISPPRAFDLWELSALIRPGLSLGDAGGFVEAELEAGYRARNWAFGAVVAPVGFGGARGHDMIAFGAAHVYGAYDGQAFAAGIGLGVTGVNDTAGTAAGGTGLSVHEMLRIGAVDGLNVTVRTSLAIFRSEIHFANLDIQGQVSVATDAWLLLRGGGGVVGYGYGEVAVRALTSGNGDAGSTFIEVGLGGSGSFVETCVLPFSGTAEAFEACDRRNYMLGGPHLSLGMEWRL